MGGEEAEQQQPAATAETAGAAEPPAPPLASPFEQLPDETNGDTAEANGAVNEQPAAAEEPVQEEEMAEAEAAAPETEGECAAESAARNASQEQLPPTPRQEQEPSSLVKSQGETTEEAGRAPAAAAGPHRAEASVEAQALSAETAESTAEGTAESSAESAPAGNRQGAEAEADGLRPTASQGAAAYAEHLRVDHPHRQASAVSSVSSVASGLTDELSKHQLPPAEGNIAEARASPVALLPSAATQVCPVHGSSSRPCRLYFCCERHSRWPASGRVPNPEIVSKWRQKERLKTSSVALVLCLNIGVDPPDVIKITPCARLECWVDPMAMQSQKALETIGKNLQAQYERWQPRAKYKMQLDPTVEDLKKLCLSSRRNAKGERMLFHYNGHGVPRPTVNGEIWVFNKTYTQYIPLSVYDLQAWVGTPAIYVFDCSAAGLVVNTFKLLLEQRASQQMPPGSHSQAAGGGYTPQPGPAAYDGAGGGDANPGAREVILLAACGAGELLPQSPDLQADVFTSCLTTPIKVALRWFCSRSLLRNEGLSKDQIDRIPGKQTDRKTLLGELNWIFTAITDTIAWNVLPRSLFQKLFRQDLLVASLFRNFLLAERIMRAANCSPVSYPQLPPTHQHPMWQAWDMAAERCLSQLPELLAGEGTGVEFQPSPFFSEQLTAFEIWLQHGSKEKRPPEQLPIVLQVLLSQVHRMRALLLLGRFLDMGPWAVDLALSVGIFPYVLKLLQTTATDLRQILVFIWTKILALDQSCQVDLVKDSGHLYFIKFLDSVDTAITATSRAMAAFVLAAICDNHPRGQTLCASSGLLGVCLSNLPAATTASSAAATSPVLLKWLLLCLGKLCENMPEITAMALNACATQAVAPMLSVDDAEVRAAAVYALGCLILPMSQTAASAAGSNSSMMENERLAAERAVACHLIRMVYDASPLVRAEIASTFGRLVAGHSLLMQDAFGAKVRLSARVLRAMSGTTSALETPGHRALSEQGGSPGSGGRSDAGSLSASHVHVSVSPRGTGPALCSRRTGTLMPALLDYTTVDAAQHIAYATADAARVGGGIYEHLCEAIFLLAQDPAAKVASEARTCLAVAGLEMVPVQVEPPPNLDKNSSTHGSSAAAGAMLMFKRSSWFSGSMSGMGMSEKGRTSVPLPPGHPKYALKKMREGTYGMPRDQHGRPVLPQSAVYLLSAEALSSPLLPPGGGDIAKGELDLPPVPLYRETFLNSTIHDFTTRDNKVQVCRTAESGLRLKENIVTLETDSEGTVAIHFSPFDALLTSVDYHGVARTYNSRRIEAGARPVNRFQLSTGEHVAGPNSSQDFSSVKPGLGASSDPVQLAVVKTFSLNELHGSGILGVCSVDGSVRLWKDHTQRGQQQLASAWQAVPRAPVLEGYISMWPTHFEYSGDHLGLLFAAGGNQPRCINAWDLTRELCVEQLLVEPWGGSTTSHSGTKQYAIETLACARDEPLLAAGCSDGCVQLIDLRCTRQPVLGLEAIADAEASSTPGTALVGMSIRSGAAGKQLVTAATNGALKFWDVRVSSSSAGQQTTAQGTVGLLRTVEAHGLSSGLTAMADHPNAPLLATATKTHTVKVWTEQGEMVGAVRAAGGFLGAGKGSAINCLQFHPYSLKLAVGGESSMIAMYTIDSNVRRPSQQMNPH